MKQATAKVKRKSHAALTGTTILHYDDSRVVRSTLPVATLFAVFCAEKGISNRFVKKLRRKKK